MKAVNAAERQRWLVALGSAKACLADTRTKKEKGMCITWSRSLLQIIIMQILWYEVSIIVF